eukprot:199425-Alexandrium_andersonii.AAC.1
MLRLGRIPGRHSMFPSTTWNAWRALFRKEMAKGARRRAAAEDASIRSEAYLAAASGSASARAFTVPLSKASTITG